MDTASNQYPALRSASSEADSFVKSALDAGGGIVRLAPCWVPRAHLVPGGRLRLNPKDIFAYGPIKGGIDERWLGSTVETTNPIRDFDEGLSYMVHDGRKLTLREAIENCGRLLLGEKIFTKYSRWPVFAKFFDNAGMIPLHLHHRPEQAAAVGQQSKPEAYYFPRQMNFRANLFPYTFFGLLPETTPDEIVQCVNKWEKEDNGILAFSQAFLLELDTSWYVPPGVLHAPGSLCTFEPQWASDVFSIFQNYVEGRYVEKNLLVKDLPASKQSQTESLVELLDWEENLASDFKRRNFRRPMLSSGGSGHGFEDHWVVYNAGIGEDRFSAKSLTVQPGERCTIKEPGAHCLIVIQGMGVIGDHRVMSPTMIDFGQLTSDEYFVSHAAASAGVTYQNTSEVEPLVVLRYFGPDVESPNA
jgi:hypothetical protein